VGGVRFLSKLTACFT